MSERGKWLRKSLEDRFHQRYIPEPNSGCWLWIGKLNAYGYGRVIRSGSKEEMAHRVSLEISGKPLAKEELACHRCDTPSCVNPDHIFAGSHADNSQDMASKKRGTLGELNRHSKLTSTQVSDIIKDHRSAKIIAADYGICEKTVRNYKSGRTWGHI